MPKYSILFLFTCSPACAQKITFLKVGDADNEAFKGKIGHVEYEFEMMETEVTNELY